MDINDDRDFIKIIARPTITVDESQSQLKDTQNLKSSLKAVTEKTKGQIENLHVAIKCKEKKNAYSTKFRETLFNRQGRQDDTTIFRQSQSIAELQSKNPSTLPKIDAPSSAAAPD